MSKNRGQDPRDHIIFGKKWKPVFRQAVDDLVYLLDREYGLTSSLQLVGNRYGMNKRQRLALMRMSDPKLAIDRRKQKECSLGELKNGEVWIDGFNQLILMENVLSGAYIFLCRDGTYRDISSVHGSYKKVSMTDQAAKLIGDVLQELGVKTVRWILDQPVSNSGRVKTLLLDLSNKHHFPWRIDLDYQPDKILRTSPHPIITSDGLILDQCHRWFNLVAYLIDTKLKDEAYIMEG